MIVCEIWFLISKKQQHPSNSKSLIKLSSLLIQRIFQQSNCQYCAYENIADVNRLTPASTYFAGYKLSHGIQNYRPVNSQKITVYSNYAGPKYRGFGQNLVNSVKVGTSTSLRHVVALWNTVNYNVQPAYLMNSKIGHILINLQM